MIVMSHSTDPPSHTLSQFYKTCSSMPYRNHHNTLQQPHTQQRPTGVTDWALLCVSSTIQSLPTEAYLPMSRSVSARAA